LSNFVQKVCYNLIIERNDYSQIVIYNIDVETLDLRLVVGSSVYQ